ncbi:hypothetical protein BKA58DRAFT_308467 [Alternaria rosae]|uniref:uncharacterized protein n=1 Tax=Alternaria rosae TaxID=1187941 RepID=UPI001E8DCF51|nr:uncharacterized protein BKA58DRAFT_308467 [Alternaria rosae]KAH6878204.1 hypothetical protein BKA58DRAFT_308467 [Alternaria rosae]
MERSDKDDTRKADYQPETPSNYVTLDTFAELTHHLRTRRCRVCDELFFSSELDIRNLFQDWANGIVDQLSCVLRCSNCNTRSCIACEPVPFATSSRIGFASPKNKQNLSWCCVGGRLFLIWAVLCGFDRRIWESRNLGNVSKQVRPESKLKPKKIQKSSRGGSQGPWSSNRPSKGSMPSGMGYGGHGSGSSGHDHDTQDDTILKARIARKKEDIFSKTILDFLTDLLPSLERETCFDFDPPGAILEMLNNSKILPHCAELLRNDSLTDVTKRKDLYQALFSFLTMVGSHSSTDAALFGPRYARPETIDLLTLSFHDEIPDAKEKVTTLAECLRNLTTQSSMMLQSAKTNQNAFKDDEDQEMLHVCHQISIFTDFIQTHMITATDSVSGKATVMVPDGLDLSDVDSKLMSKTHYYWNTAKTLGYSQPGRFKRLITEITTLQTGLPPGIFVRYCEDRPDILKCIIVGPAGTPYENGLFEFDLFCGAAFPNDPPQVNFKGTAGGRICINPNLYADGKVCLSLLGTWSGEPWNPGESTLLQVLISIQAMILCEEPWYNEPGREAGYTRSLNGPSAMYNRKIRDHTARTAILAWLDEPPPLWKDVVDFHFKQQGNTILKTVEEWAKEKMPESNNSASERTIGEELYAYDEAFAEAMAARRPAPEFSDVGSLLPQLQTALRKYGATFRVEYVAPPAPPAPKRKAAQANHFGPGFSPYPPGSWGPATSSSEAPTWASMADSSEAPTWASVASSTTAPTEPPFSFDNLDAFAEYMGIQNPQDAAHSAEAPRYELRSSTRGRGSGEDLSTRGGQGSSGTGHAPYNSNTMNYTRGGGGVSPGTQGLGQGGLGRGGRGNGTGRGDRGGRGRGRGRGDRGGSGS